MRHILAISAALTAAGLAAGCTPSQLQQAQAVVAAACAGAQAGSAVVSTDGAILGSTAAQKAAIAKGQALVTVNCAATQSAVAALVAAQSAGASPGALLRMERKAQADMHLSDETLRRLFAPRSAE